MCERIFDYKMINHCLSRLPDFSFSSFVFSAILIDTNLQCNTNLQETADLLGVCKTNVTKMRKAMHEELKGRVEAAKPNGGRRPQNMTLDDELILLNSLKESALIEEHVDPHAIKKAYEEKLGRAVHISTITRLLKRHGWVKLAPRKYHPKRNLRAKEAFKKTSAKSRLS